MSAKKAPIFWLNKGVCRNWQWRHWQDCENEKKFFERNFLKKIDMPMPYEFLSATVHSNRIYLNL